MSSTLSLPQIGIIGGAGPLAGALLFQKIIQRCQEKYFCQKDGDFPYILLLNYPFKEMMENIIDSEQKILIQNQLKECLNCFIKNKIKIVAIACNTLHEFLEEKDSYIFLIHMIKETALYLQQNRYLTPLVLCTETSARYQLHKKYFDCFYPSENLQLQLQQLINKILAGRQSIDDAQRLVELLNRQISSLQELPGQDVRIVLGCTEFSLLNEQFPLHKNGLSECITLIDPNQITAEKICSLIFKDMKQ